MKVRWKYGSLRLRITPSELKDLLGGQQIFERFELSGGPVWEVSVYPSAEQTSLRNRGAKIELMLSQEDQNKLALPETQGVYFLTDPSNHDSIRYFIEKDFPCIHPRAADALEVPSETFSPPAGFISDEEH
jgi:hypothetical protein